MEISQFLNFQRWTFPDNLAAALGPWHILATAQGLEPKPNLIVKSFSAYIDYELRQKIMINH
jgi:hypothetical protein